MVKTIQQVKLIDGLFSPHEAREIINNMLDAKINFHNLRKFSNEERFGGIDKESKLRIEELKVAKESLKEIFQHEDGDKRRIRIDSMIDITIEED